MLLALTCAFALSQAYRTVAAIMAPALQQDFGLSAQGLGLFAATFHFAFGGLQLAMGIGVDMHGVRRTVLAAFPLAIAGALLSAMAPGFGPCSTAEAATRSSFSEESARANTASPISVSGMPWSSAEITVHLPVPFCPARSRITSTTSVPV